MHTPNAVFAFCLLCAAVPVVAQDPFEIQVYEYVTVKKGFWDLEAHLNQIARGERLQSGTVAPTQDQTHLTFELTRGITDYFELAGYLVTARRHGVNGELVGWRVRPRFRIPEGKLPFKFSLSTEFGFPKNTYEEAEITFELRPIVEWEMKGIDVDVNPTLGRSIRGPGASAGWDFEPGLRLGLPSSGKLQWSFEYYGSTGEVTNPLPFKQQVHQFVPGFDYDFNDNVMLNVGVGVGATGAGNTLVFKTRLGWLFK
jgi:hypothetical protein